MMTRAEQQVYEIIRDYYRRCGPLRTMFIADTMGKSDRALRYTLVRLERQGRVMRVGQRGGWLPAACGTSSGAGAVAAAAS